MYLRDHLCDLVEQRSPSSPYRQSWVHALRNDQGGQMESIVGLQGRIANIRIAPLKSAGMLGVSDEALITDHGLATPDGLIPDRGMMLARRRSGKDKATGESYGYARFSQRKGEEGRLVLLKPAYNQKKQTLNYTYKNAKVLELHPDDFDPKQGDAGSVQMYPGRLVTGTLASSSIRDAMRNFLASLPEPRPYAIEDIEVIVRNESFTCPVEEMHDRDQRKQTIYSDGGEVTFGSANTAAWCNQHSKGRPIEFNAYRLNIMLEGIPANIEDGIDSVCFYARKKIEAYMGGASVKCSTPQVLGTTGLRPDKEPLETLKEIRPPRPESPDSVTFGINGVFVPSASEEKIRKGVLFEITAEKYWPESAQR